MKLKPVRPRRPEIFVLCDVSTSVTSASVFFLSVMHALHDSFRKMRSFVFIERISEVTEVFAKERDFKAVSEAIGRDAGVADISGYTDYGRVWREFRDLVEDELHPRATVIVLGDARTNGRDPARRDLRLDHRQGGPHVLAEPRAAPVLELRRLRDRGLRAVLPGLRVLDHAPARGLRPRPDEAARRRRLSSLTAPHERTGPVLPSGSYGPTIQDAKSVRPALCTHTVDRAGQRPARKPRQLSAGWWVRRLGRTSERPCCERGPAVHGSRSTVQPYWVGRAATNDGTAHFSIMDTATPTYGLQLTLTDIERVALDHAYDMFADIGADIAYVNDEWRPSLADLDKAVSWLSAARAMLGALESNALPLPLDSDLADALELFARDCMQDLQVHREALVEARCTMVEAVEAIRASIDRALDDLTGSRSILERASAMSST